MKKQLLALAVTSAFAVPAMAQNVTLSGVIDLSPYQIDNIEHKAPSATATNETKRASTTNVVANGGFVTSVLNFTGTEDLGGGLRATFFVNQSLNGNTGALGGRDMWLQLNGGFGAFKLGRYHPNINGYGGFSSTGSANLAGSTDFGGFGLIGGALGADQTRASQTGTVNRAAGGDFSRQPGVLQYTTPSFSGLTGWVEYISNSEDASEINGKAKTSQYGLGANFVRGPLTLAGGYGSRDVDTEAVAATSTVGIVAGVPAVITTAARAPVQNEAKVFWLGARYNFGVAEVQYSYGDREDKTNSSGVNAKTSDITVHTIGVRVPLGSAQLFANFFDGEDKRDGTSALKTDLSGFQLGARYNLSRRTYLYFVHGKNESDRSSYLIERTHTALGLVHTF